MARRFPLRTVVASACLLLAFTLAALLTGRWALAAVPLGFLLGHFLARGELCSASAFSESLFFRDRSKLAGLWAAVVTSMVCFAVFDLAGLLQLCPRPFFWVAYLVAGGVFGIGMVLAGGCVSGTLYKCGTGHATSMAALMAMPVGILAVHYGPPAGIDTALRRYVLAGTDGAPLTLASVTGLPYAALACALALLTLIVGVRCRRKRLPPPGVRKVKVRLRDRLFTSALRPWQAGVLVGLLAVPAWLTSRESGRDFPLCVTYGVEQAPLLVTESSPAIIWDREGVRALESGEYFEPGRARDSQKWIYIWLVFFVAGVIPGALVAARLMGRGGLKRRPPSELLVALCGGLFVGVGAGLGQGCILGNGVMGAAFMSFGMILFAVSACLTNWLTSWLYLFGGPFSGSSGKP